MITVVSGIRDLHEASHADVELAVLDELSIASELRFGGAIGVDTVALRAVCASDIVKVGYVPMTVADQPSVARQALRECASRIVEMKQRPSRAAYLRRNDRMLDGADRLLAFTDGRSTGGTAYTIGKARARGLDVALVPVLASAATLVANPRIDPAGSPWPIVGYRTYVGSLHGYDWTSDLVRRMKAGQVSESDVKKLARRIANFIAHEPLLASADAITAMPRRHPGVPSDLAPLVQVIASVTGQRVLEEWLVRREEPVGPVLWHRRERFPAAEHERTMAVAGTVPAGVRRVMVLDNVLTFGGTMLGALGAVARDAPDLGLVGLAVLVSKGALNA